MSDQEEDLEELLKELEDPVLIVDRREQGALYILNPMTLDPNLDSPDVFGIIISDLMANIASIYATNRGGDVVEWRKIIDDAVKKEEELKRQDPTRGEPSLSNVIIHKTRLN